MISGLRSAAEWWSREGFSGWLCVRPQADWAWLQTVGGFWVCSVYVHSGAQAQGDMLLLWTCLSEGQSPEWQSQANCTGTVKTFAQLCLLPVHSYSLRPLQKGEEPLFAEPYSKPQRWGLYTSVNGSPFHHQGAHLYPWQSVAGIGSSLRLAPGTLWIELAKPWRWSTAKAVSWVLRTHTCS